MKLKNYNTKCIWYTLLVWFTVTQAIVSADVHVWNLVCCLKIIRNRKFSTGHADNTSAQIIKLIKSH
jgi:hypothetical protein